MDSAVTLLTPLGEARIDSYWGETLWDTACPEAECVRHAEPVIANMKLAKAMTCCVLGAGGAKEVNIEAERARQGRAGQ